MELQAYIPGGLAIAMALAFAGALLLVAMYRVVPGKPKRVSAEKAGPFECGIDPVGSPRARFSVKFYQVAIMFMVFDVESAFMYPWVVWYRAHATVLGFVEMLLFVVVLAVALTYVWRKKAIGWD